MAKAPVLLKIYLSSNQVFDGDGVPVGEWKNDIAQGVITIKAEVPLPPNFVNVSDIFAHPPFNVVASHEGLKMCVDGDVLPIGPSGECPKQPEPVADNRPMAELPVRGGWF